MLEAEIGLEGKYSYVLFIQDPHTHLHATCNDIFQVFWVTPSTFTSEEKEKKSKKDVQMDGKFTCTVSSFRGSLELCKIKMISGMYNVII